MNDIVCSSPLENVSLSTNASSVVLPDISIDEKRRFLEQEGNIVLSSDRIDGFRVTATTDLRNVFIEHEGSVLKAEDVIFDAVVLNHKELAQVTIKYISASVVDLIGCRFSEDPEREQLIKTHWGKYSDGKVQDVPLFQEIVFNQEDMVAVTDINLVTFRTTTYCGQQEISPELTSHSDYQQKEVQLYRANPELYEAVMRFYVWYVSEGIPDSKDDWTPEIEEKVSKAADKLWQDYLSGDLKAQPVFKINAEEDDEARARQRRLSNNLPVMDV